MLIMKRNFNRFLIVRDWSIRPFLRRNSIVSLPQMLNNGLLHDTGLCVEISLSQTNAVYVSLCT